MIKRFFFISMILLFELLGVVACGTVQQTDTALEDPENIYRVEKEVVMNIEETVLADCYVTEQYIYYVQTDSEFGSSLWKQEIGTDKEATQFFSFAEDEMLQTFTVTEAGDVIAAVKGLELPTELVKINGKGELLWRSEFPERQDSPFIFHILEGSDSRIYASTQQDIFFWNALGEFERCLTVSGELIQHLADAGGGKVAVLQHKKKGQRLTVYQGADGKEEFQKDFQEERWWFGDEKGLFYSVVDILAQYHWDSDSSEAVMNFTDCGIGVSSIRFFRDLGEDRFLIGLGDEGSSSIHFVWLTASEVQQSEDVGKEEQPKIQLVVATFNPRNLQSGIVNFNRSHENYELVTEAFEIDFSTFVSQHDRFNAYITSADGPDIIDPFNEIDFHTHARDGYLQDLTPFIEKSEKISKDDFLPRVLEDIVVDGKLYTIPRRIILNAFACPTELLAGKTSWTIEEYLDLLEQYPNALSGDGVPAERVKSNILRRALYEGINGFVNWETGEAFFDEKEFCSILERIAELEVKEITQSREEMAQNGEVVFWDLSLNRTNELLLAEWRSGQELTLIGFPVSGKVEEERSRNHISYSELMVIHSASKETEAAWDYVEEYMTGGLFKNDYFFRTGKEAFEERIQEDVGVETWTLDGVLPPATQEEADKVRSAFLEGIYYYGENKPLLDIIEEEAEPYFRGEKGLEDVAGIIQSRIQVYLNERG